MSDRKKPILPYTIKTLEAEQLPIFTSDPATFLVASSVINKVRESVSELRKWLTDSRPDLDVVLEVVLTRMKNAGHIEIVGDRIIVLKDSIWVNMQDPKVVSSMHKVAVLTMRRIHENLTEDYEKHFPDSLNWFSMPDHPKVQKRMAQIHKHCIAEMSKLHAEILEDPDIKGNFVRFMMIFNGPLKPEDF